MKFFEENLARTLQSKFNLVPPINILELIKSRTKFEICHIPADIEAISYNLKVPGKRPGVILNQRKQTNDERTRFTLAHELGHVLIPWHLGDYYDDEETLNWSQLDEESEANRFASELLLPSHWVKEKVGQEVLSLNSISDISRQAQTSLTATIIKVLSILPAGNIFIRADSTGLINMSGTSPDTLSGRLSRGEKITSNDPYPLATKKWQEQIGPNTYFWWYVPAEIVPPEPVDTRSWREIFANILEDIAPQDKAKAQQRINGIIGSAKSMVKNAAENRTVSKDKLYSSLLQRFQNACNGENQQLYTALMNHPLCKDFLTHRLEDLVIDKSSKK